MDDNQSILDLQIDQSASRSLSDAARWARFLAIVGFIGLGLLILCLLLLRGEIIGALSELAPPTIGVSESYGFVVAIIVIAALVVGLLMYFLLRGATLIRRGIETRNQETFNNGLSSLRAYFTAYGVFAILGVIGNLLLLF